jgi:hypothetical protein
VYLTNHNDVDAADPRRCSLERYLAVWKPLWRAAVGSPTCPSEWRKRPESKSNTPPNPVTVRFRQERLLLAARVIKRRINYPFLSISPAAVSPRPSPIIPRPSRVRKIIKLLGIGTHSATRRLCLYGCLELASSHCACSDSAHGLESFSADERCSAPTAWSLRRLSHRGCIGKAALVGRCPSRPRPAITLLQAVCGEMSPRSAPPITP